MTAEQDRREDAQPRAPIATRAAPPRPRRLSRKAMTVLGATAAFGVAGALAWSLSKDDRRDAPSERVGVSSRQGAEVLGDAPQDYSDLARRDAAGIGAPGATSDTISQTAPAEAAVHATPAGADTAEAEAQRRRQQAEAARGAKLFAASDTGRRPDTDSQAAVPSPSPSGQSASTARPSSTVPETEARLSAPATDTMLLAGSTIAAALITGLSSDLPGQAVAQVTEDVFDSVTGRTRLIPQGARLIGDYDARVTHGQTRALVVWTRLILPDGRSLDLGRMVATDGSGASGLADRVDNHWGSIVKAGMLSTLFGIGTELGNTGDDAIADAIRDSAGQTIGRAGDRIVERQLQIQPTITIRPGARVRVLVSRDIRLPAWDNLEE